MNQDTLLYTLPQWFVFAAFVATAYGWVEQKKVFTLTGPLILVLLGIFAFYHIQTGSFSSYHYLTPEEIVSEEMEEDIPGTLPFLARLLPAYWCFVASAVLAIPSLYFIWKEKKKPKILFMVLTGLTALPGFFIIAGALSSL